MCLEGKMFRTKEEGKKLTKNGCFVFLSKAHQKRMMNDPYRSFSNDINTCLFGDWVTDGVLSNQVTCTGQKLCYGKYGGTKALFAVCYNTNTLIPEFTGNVVQSGGTVGENNMIQPDEYDPAWKKDEGLGNIYSRPIILHNNRISLIQLLSQLVGRSINQSTNQLISQSVNQSINQSINPETVCQTVNNLVFK